MSFKSNGNLDKLRKNLSKLSGTNKVGFTEMFTDEFVSSCSRYHSIQDLFEASEFKVETMADFSAIPDEVWDVFIKSNTDYESWIDMQKAANVAYMKKQLNKGLK